MFLISILCSLAFAQDASYLVDQISPDGVVKFKADASGNVPHELDTRFFDAEVLGSLKDPAEAKNLPFFLVRGKPCKDCEDEKSLLLIRADGKGPKLKLVHPGKVRRREDKKTIYESRAFYGQCLARYGQVYLNFQYDQVKKRGGLQPSVFVAELKGDSVAESVIVRGRPNIQEVLRNVKRQNCHEVPALMRSTMSFNISGMLDKQGESVQKDEREPSQEVKSSP